VPCSNARAHPFLGVSPRAVLNDYAFDAFEMQHMGKKQTRRTGAYDADAGPDSYRHIESRRLPKPWKT
jgi:hypothetical protein